MSKAFAYYEHGEEIPVGLRALADQQEATLIENIRGLISMEISEHLCHEHDCSPGCYSMSATDAIVDRMPESQVRALALRMNQMLAISFLRSMADGEVRDSSDVDWDSLTEWGSQ